MTYQDAQYEFARYGFTSTPITEVEFEHCVSRGADLDDIYGIGCDIAAGFDLIEFLDMYLPIEVVE